MANSEHVALAMERLVEMHGRLLGSDAATAADLQRICGSSAASTHSRAAGVLGPDARRAEWFEVQSSLERLQAAQSATVSFLNKAVALQPLLDAAEEPGADEQEPQS